jgi:phosphoribosylanthranilate isomerase
MKLKICGMKYQENIEAVAALKPDYLGFIFYENSPRNFEGEIPTIPSTIKKVGVFVDASIDFIKEKVKQYDFKAIQLHGNETPQFCQDLQGFKNLESLDIELWKVFSIKDQFDFNRLQPYEDIVDYFLFDTKGKEKGGNGYTFDWSVLKGYPSSTPFILSGGIGLDETQAILSFQKSPESQYLHAIDVNSKFESEPGVKSAEKLKKMISNLQGFENHESFNKKKDNL